MIAKFVAKKDDELPRHPKTAASSDSFSENKTCEAILNCIDKAIFIMDDKGHIMYLNQAAERIEGYRMEDVKGRHIRDVYHETDWQYSRLWETIRSGRPMRDVQCVYPSKNKLVNIIADNHPLFANGKIVGGVCVYEELESYRKSVEKKLEYISRMEPRNPRVKSRQRREQLYTFDQIVGTSDALQSVITLAKNTARSDSSIMIYGETGTGKELFAQSIHSASHRSGGPLMTINCAAIPENLLEGILFGTSKGVYTDAMDKAGLFEQANGGTMFLDEINWEHYQFVNAFLM